MPDRGAWYPSNNPYGSPYGRPARPQYPGSGGRYGGSPFGVRPGYAGASPQTAYERRLREQAEAEARAQAQAEAQAREYAHAQAVAQARREAQAQAQAAAQARREAEARARAQRRAEEEARQYAQAQEAAQARARAEADARARAEVQRRAQAQAAAQAQAKAEADAHARMRAQAQASPFGAAFPWGVPQAQSRRPSPVTAGAPASATGPSGVKGTAQSNQKDVSYVTEAQQAQAAPTPEPEATAKPDEAEQAPQAKPEEAPEAQEAEAVVIENEPYDGEEEVVVAGEAEPLTETISEKVIEELKSEKKAWEDRYMRLHAEWDTYRRRTAEQREVEKARATEKLVGDLIPVIDDFERTITYATENGEAGLLDGVKAVYAKLGSVLERDGVVVIDPVGEPFNALEAQAVATVPDTEAYDETVRDVYQKGYKMGTKVLRPAMVTVTTGGPARPAPEAE